MDKEKAVQTFCRQWGSIFGDLMQTYFMEGPLRFVTLNRLDTGVYFKLNIQQLTHIFCIDKIPIYVFGWESVDEKMSYFPFIPFRCSCFFALRTEWFRRKLQLRKFWVFTRRICMKSTQKNSIINMTWNQLSLLSKSEMSWISKKRLRVRSESDK